MANYDPITHATFYTIVFPSEVFLDPQKHFNYIGPFHSHEDIPNNFNYTKFDEVRRYCVLVHGENISTAWNIPIKGSEVVGVWKPTILEEFGIDATPMKVRTSNRMRMRQILNYLPFKGLLKKIYDKQNIIRI